MKTSFQDALLSGVATTQLCERLPSGGGVAFATNVKQAPDTLLTRAVVAAELTRAGFPISPATLATKATRGGGPPYRLFGRRPLYEWGPALEWARGRLSAPVPNTSAASAA